MLNVSECYVVLGHLMDADGELSDESKMRVLKLHECIETKKGQLIFFCGWDYRDDSNIKLAEALNSFFLKHNNEHHDIHLSDLSRDTVGDAVLLRYFFGHLIENKKINLITSDYHASRAKKIFEFVFNINTIIPYTAKSEVKGDKSIKENQSIKAFKKTFQDIEPGNIEEIYTKLVTSHPYYNGEMHSKLY